MDAEQIAQIIATPVNKSREVTSSALSNAANQQNRLVQALQIEQQRTAALRGANSSQAKQAQSLLTAHQQSLARAQANADATKVAPPLSNGKEFIIYGVVRGKSGQPVGEIEVSAVDAQGKIYNSAVSGSDGSYTLHLEIANPEPAPVEDSAQRIVAASSTSTAPPAPLTVQLAAADRKKTFLAHSQNTFEVTLGKLAYQDLIVPV